MKQIVINIFESEQGGYMYDIFVDKDFDELYDVDSEDGGHCVDDTGETETTINDALGMATSQAEYLIKKLNK